jgi:beta-glucosidase
MTDWWANINERGKQPDKDNFAAMVRAQNDVYMVCADGENHTDNIAKALEDGSLTRGELQRCAKNVLNFLLGTHAMKRMMKQDEKVDVINKPDETIDAEAASRVYYLDDELEIDLSDVKVRRNMDHSFTIERARQGAYSITITASSNASELAQLPVTIFSVGTALGTFTFNGTGGKPVSFTIDKAYFFSRFSVIRLHFRLAGLDLISIKFKRIGD